MLGDSQGNELMSVLRRFVVVLIAAQMRSLIRSGLLLLPYFNWLS